MVVSLVNHAKEYAANLRWALARKLDSKHTTELEIYVKILYAAHDSQALVGNITVSHALNMPEQIAMIYGTVQQSVETAIQGLPRQERRKIKGYDVILKDSRSLEETSWEQRWYGKHKFLSGGSVIRL